MPKMKFGEIQEEFDKIIDPVPADRNEDKFDDYDEIEDLYNKDLWKECGKLKVLGLKKEKYLNDDIIRGNKINYPNSEAYNIVVQDTKNQKAYVICLTSRKLSSHYSNKESYGMLDIREAKEADFEYTHVPMKETFLQGFFIEPEYLRYMQEIKYQTDERGIIKRDTNGKFLKENDYSDGHAIIDGVPYFDEYQGRVVRNNVFTYSSSADERGYGDDECPRGFVKVNMDLFHPLTHGDKNRRVWLVAVKSDEDVAKLTSQLPGFKIFDSGKANKISQKTDADVIVLRGEGRYDTRLYTKHISGQPNIEISYVPEQQIDNFIAKQQEINPGKHNYMGCKVPKIREAFQHIAKLIKENNPCKDKPKKHTSVKRSSKDERNI